MGIDSNQFLSTYPVRNSYSLSLAPQEGTVETPTGRGRASNCSIGSTARPPAATSTSSCASEQQLSPSAKLPEDEVAEGYDNDDDDDDDDDELIILPKDKSSKVSALVLERPGDG